MAVESDRCDHCEHSLTDDDGETPDYGWVET